ncbi:MAG: DUF2231 domain-containing protein [Armatimonadota bacterium]|nr:DUF2231 domain-containing protein [Armatimonadota bacterium]
MRSNVHIRNHPLHPILVLLPVGLWIGSLIFDIVYFSTGNGFWFRAAFWNILFGVITALIAAIAGFIDLFTLPMSEAARRTGLTHMTLNLAIVVLYVINLFTRGYGTPVTTSAAMTPFVLNIISVALLLISGWLGGEMIYRHGVAVPEAAAEEATRYARAVPGAGRPGIAGARGGEAAFPEEEERHQ